MIEQKGIITVIDEPTYVEDMGKLLAKYAIKETQGVKFDIRRIKDKRYFVKKAYQIISNPDRPNDADSVQWRVLLVRCLEQMLKTEFRNTRDFKEKCKSFIKRSKTEEDIRRSVGKRIIRARKKLEWDQKKLAEFLGYRSRKTIQRYENDSVYPPIKILNWLKGVEVQ